MTRVDPRERLVYHFTHLDNVSSITAAGRVECDRTAGRGLTKREVGDPEIKNSRRERPVPSGGAVGDYVPFYFATRSPMMYRIACDHRDLIPGRYPDGDRPLVYFAARLGTLLDADMTWVATDGNAAAATTRFLSTVDDLAAAVDWPLMEQERWNSIPDDPDRQRRRMAEFLVHGAVPLAAIHGVAAYSEAHATKARTALAPHPLAERVIVRPAWYYGYGRG